MAYQNTIRIIRGSLTLTIYKAFVKTLTLLTILRQQNTPSPRSPLIVYITTNHELTWLAILAMLSFKYFIQNVHFKIINGGGLTHRDYKWLKRTKLSLSFVTSEEERKTERLLRPYPYLHKYFQYGWSGKKFFIPLLTTPSDRYMILDLDIIFFRSPTHIIKWFHAHNPPSMYMKDYENFSAISTVEAAFILQQEPKHININSGLLCINSKQLLKHTPLATLNKYSRYILQCAKNRLSYDHNTDNDVVYVYPVIEQSLFWLAFEKQRAQSLPKEAYYIFPRHKFKHTIIRNPICIHFTGEETKRSIYKYLFFSFFSMLKDVALSKKILYIPWHNYSNNYCVNCNHLSTQAA